MSKKILLVGLAGFLLQTGIWAQQNYEETVREIHTLNLIRGLELTPEQANFIISKGQQIENLKQAWQQKYQEHAAAYEDLKKALLYGGEVPKSVAEKTRQAQKDVTIHERNYLKGIKQAALEIKEQLKDYQLYALEHYKPCLIPPKGEVRVGQVEDSEALAGFLDRIRNVPASDYEKRKTEIAEEVVARGVKHLPKDYKIDQDKAKETIYSVFQEARGLSETDFAVQRKDLAQKLKSPFTLPPASPNVVNSIAKFLLTPEALRLLQTIYQKP